MSDSPRVELREDVVFGSGGGRELKGDLFLPPTPEGPSPAVVLVHGGAWRVGSPAQLRGYGFLIGREGFVCFAPEYRLSGEAHWPAPLHDVKAAVRFLRAHADEYGIDPDRIVVSGNSAGGHLAMMAALTTGHPDFEGDGGNADQSSGVAGAVALYGQSHVEHGGDVLTDSVDALMGDSAVPDDYAAASPMTYVSADQPPLCLMHALGDDLIPWRQSLDMFEAAKAVGAQAEIHLYDGVPHDFDANPILGREVARLIVSFVGRHAPSKAPS